MTPEQRTPEDQLELLGIEQPAEMTGQSLIRH